MGNKHIDVGELSQTRGWREEFKEDWVNGMGNEQKDDRELS